ncbi:MAG: single-stranded-DNA-specific exonuclease RecJ [Alphaproteobacteria bacterium]|nr:single-stranded-DNA-specific exonuclease RecJ [Alphaproteobacteria bacterium]
MRSVLGFAWQQKNFDERRATTIRQRFYLSEVLSNLLAARGVELAEVENFLDPKIKTSLPDPFELNDMEKAVDHVIAAILDKKKITIFADYDVDGATSAAILKRFFQAVGVDANIYIPDRILEGYGPNSAALLHLKKSGTDLVITLDCGTVAFKPLEDAASAGLDVIVIDHHLGVLEKPQSIAVINPNLLDETFPHKNLCAAGVTFLFVVAINRKLRECGFYHPPLEGQRPRSGAEQDHPPLEEGSKSLATSRGGQEFPRAEKFYSAETLAKAKTLRANQTDAESLLWYYLQNKQLDGHKFRRQQPIGNYIADFVCLEKKLVVELDGGQHNEESGIKYDQKRTDFLQQSGFRVLRFCNEQVFKNISDVLDGIFGELNQDPSPKSQATSTLPQGEGEFILRRFADAGPQGEGDIREPNLLNLLDLVALGTVCDVMSLTGLNRAFVAAGLKILRQRKNPGLREIYDLAGLNEEPSAYHLGFVIGPRINAGGRVGNSNLGARILSGEDEEEIKTIAKQLETLNKQRKDLEAQVLDEAVKSLESGAGGFSKNDPVIFAAANNWHQGVIGIVASRLKDLYNKPVAVIALDDEAKKGKASCRSIAGIDFGAEILKARLSGLLLEGGGHAMAGGFSVNSEKLSELHEFFCRNLGEKITEITAQKNAEYDIALDLAQVNLELLKELAKLEPFGVGNVRPKFLLRDVVKVRANLVGQNKDHVSCIFSAKSALGFSGQIQATAFRSAKSILGEILLDPKMTKPLNLVGTLNINSWMGVEKVQMIIEDLIFS